MTVAELIELLKRWPPDLEIGYSDSEDGWTEITDAYESHAWRYAPGGLTECRVLRII